MTRSYPEATQKWVFFFLRYKKTKWYNQGFIILIKYCFKEYEFSTNKWILLASHLKMSNFSPRLLNLRKHFLEVLSSAALNIL